MLSKNSAKTSLKKTFFKQFFWGALIFWLVISLLAYLSSRHEIDELYDSEMSQIARVLLGIYGSLPIDQQTGIQIISSPSEGSENYERKLAFQIWDGNDTLLLRSANAPLEPLALKPGMFSTRTLLGTKMRTLSIRGPEGRLSVHVGQNIEIRRENAAEILESLSLILLLAFPILLWLINKGLNQGTRSLNVLSEKIARRTENDLSPIKANNIPVEISGIVDALNKLMTKVQTALGRERQFIADASHELRTPLSGIKAQAQLGLKDQSHQQASLLRIVEGVERTTRIANQLLTLSGVDAMNNLEESGEIHLKNLIEKVLHDLDTAIEEKSIQISCHFDTEKTVIGNEDLLYILARNLIDNAIRYSPHSSEIKIEYVFDNNSLALMIIDQGPGIAVDQRKRVFDRFYRNIDTQGTGSGSGLGLAIVQKIVSLHHAQITFNSAGPRPGFCAKVIFKTG